MQAPSNATALPSLWAVFPDLQQDEPTVLSTDNAFFLQDPLGGHYSYPPPGLPEWNCTAQLEQEAGACRTIAADVHRRHTQ